MGVARPGIGAHREKQVRSTIGMPTGAFEEQVHRGGLAGAFLLPTFTNSSTRVVATLGNCSKMLKKPLLNIWDASAAAYASSHPAALAGQQTGRNEQNGCEMNGLTGH
jgi:hypothetical protein